MKRCKASRMLCVALLLSLAAGQTPAPGDESNAASKPRVSVLDNEQAWQRLPECEEGAGEPLPVWARAYAATVPHSVAYLLELDYLYRTSRALDPQLRAKIRWEAARANRCQYSRLYAEADLRRAGMSRAKIDRWIENRSDLSTAERAALAFARQMTLDAAAVTDEQFAELVELFDERQVVAMVLQLAYANFQDRLLLALDLPVEDDGPLPPLKVRFAKSERGPHDIRRADRPPLPESAESRPAAASLTSQWSSLTFNQLQEQLEAQRARSPRVSVPAEGQVRAQIPPHVHPPNKPLEIQWSLVVLGHQPELGTAWLDVLRAFGNESGQDRVFGNSLFWIVTRSLDCFY